MLDIESIKAKIIPVCQRYDVKNVFLFGSYARGTAKDTSDIDLRVDLGEKLKGFAIANFYAEMEEQLGCPLDIMTTRQLSADFLDRIRNDEVHIYAN